MSDLTEATVRGVVRSEMANLQNDIKRLEGLVLRVEARLNELQTVQSEVHRMVSGVTQLQDQLRNVPLLSQSVQHIQTAIDEVRTRAQHAEESARYTAGYVAMRLKERYEKGVES